MFLRKGFSIESKCVYIFQHFMWIHVFALLESNIKRKSINVSSMRSQNVGFRSFSLEFAIYLSLSLFKLDWILSQPFRQLWNT